jgi:hypothetical protein
MRASFLTAAAALVGVCILGLAGGDPRGAPTLGVSTGIAIAGSAVALAVGWIAWRAGRRRSGWLLPPAMGLALAGALCGWIAGVEILGDVDRAARLAAAPKRVAFLVGMTAFWMAAFPLALTAASDAIKRLARART